MRPLLPALLLGTALASLPALQAQAQRPAAQSAPIAQRMCYLYSPSPDRLQERSLWTCWRTGQAPDGTPVLLDGAGNALPVLSRTRGNGLEARSRSFLQVAAERYGGAIPSPQDPATPPPP